MSLLVLSAANVDLAIQSIALDDLLLLMANVFVALARSTTAPGGVIIPQRSSITSDNHTTLFMPSRMASLGTAIKLVSVPTPTAPAEIAKRGLPASTAVIDETTGAVIALVNARKLTALRNAASSLLATRLMLPPEAQPETLAAIGAGAQISTHISLFLLAYPSIRSCKIINRSLNDRVDRLLAALRPRFPSIRFEALRLTDDLGVETEELKPAIIAANIIVTATSSKQPLFPSAYVSPGTHLCLIGSYTPAMHEVDSALIKRASKIVADYKKGVLTEAGELIAAQTQPHDILELGELIDDSKSSGWTANLEIVKKIRPQQDRGDVTIFKSVGVGIQDVAITRAIVDHARLRGIGTIVEGYDE